MILNNFQFLFTKIKMNSNSTVPLDPSKKFYQAYINHFNYFSFERVYQGHVYEPKPNSILLCLPNYTPTFLERPILYWMFLPKYF